MKQKQKQKTLQAISERINTRLMEVVPGAIYTSTETAGFLRVQPETLEVWRATARYPHLRHIKIGGRVCYKGQAILDFLDSPHERAASYAPKNPRTRPTLVRGRVQQGTKRGSR